MSTSKYILKSSKSFSTNLVLIFLGLASLLIMVSPGISPATWWFSALLAYLVLPVTIIHLLVLPWLLYQRYWYVLVAVVVLAVAIPFFSKIYGLNKTVEPIEGQKHSFRVLSYNTSFFSCRTGIF